MKILYTKKSGLFGLSVNIASLALALVFTICGRNFGWAEEPVSDGSLQKVLEARQFIIGFDAGFPPMSFIDGNGEFVGFDIDMIQEICNRLGVDLVKRPINWNAKEDELNSGAIDGIVSMSVIGASAGKMNLSEAYIKENLIFVVPGGSKAKWLRDLKGKRVGVQSGSITQETLETLDIYKEISVKLFDDNLALLQDLRKGELDAGLVDSLIVCYFIDSSSEQYFILGESLGEEDFAIGFRKNDNALRNRVQEILGDIKADGTLGKISKKWFGSDITIVM